MPAHIMTMPLSDRLKKIKASPTIAVSAKAAALRAEGKDMISLSLGEPDFDTPEFIKQAAVEAMQRGQTKYTAVGGTSSLKQAIVSEFARRQMKYTPSQVIVSAGAKQSIFNALYAVLNEGDQVIIPAPYWVSYPDMVLLAGGEPVVLQTDLEHNLKLSKEQLAGSITPKTKAIILNSPCNPTGMVYTRSELSEIADVLLEHPHIWVLTDDIYGKIFWGEEPFSNLVNVCPRLIDRTIVVDGVSKAYAMTGWRIGFAVGPEAVISAMAKLQSQSTSCPNSIAQAAAEAALNGDQQCIKQMVEAFKARSRLVTHGLEKVAGVRCIETQGAFYSFPDMRQVMKRMGLEDDVALANYLLEKAEVAVVPGSAFGAPGFVRVSFAASEAVLSEALKRIACALA